LFYAFFFINIQVKAELEQLYFTEAIKMA